MSIRIHKVSKVFANQQALKDVSFSIEKGEIVGFLGPNGAGKSTLMKIITGYSNATEGEVIVNGFNIIKEKLSAQNTIGYLPENNPLYLEMYIKEYLFFIASIYKISKSRVEEIIKKVGLLPEIHKKIGTLSKGYRQRVGLAAAILHKPDVLILDEPTTGLDPNQLIDIRRLIKEFGKDKTVLLSTHILQEVEAVCDRVIIINNGEIVADQNLRELKTKEKQVIEVEFDLKIEKQFLKKLPNLDAVNNVHDSIWELTFDTSEDMRSAVFDFAQENGLKTLKLNTRTKGLESLFKELTT